MSTSNAPISPSGTAAAATFFIALALFSNPSNPTTVSPLASALEHVRALPRTTTRLPLLDNQAPLAIPDVTHARSTDISGNLVIADEPERATTSREKLIGEIRRWALLQANWDKEGGAAPSAPSLKQAVAFVRLLDERAPLPEPMLLDTGNAGLFWQGDDLYADLEFLGDGRIAYFIKRQGDKHKGILNFDNQHMPPVFPALILA